MSRWPATKARRVLAALLRIGWNIKRQSGGSHRVLARQDWPDFIFAFYDDQEIGPRMLAVSADARVFSRTIYEEGAAFCSFTPCSAAPRRWFFVAALKQPGPARYHAGAAP